MNAWTFLFTDIEDSTGHYERAGEIYHHAAARHFELLRAHLGAHGGEPFRETGDGLLAAFTDSRAALACATACQQALRAIEWPPELGELRVRIGVHRGEAERADGEFQGLTMHHATRVLDAAHGAQILCSAAVRDHAGTEGRPPLGDLGLYRLRGVPTPVRLFQVSYDGMPGAGFPAPRTPPAFTHKLPASPTRFFGREAELHDLATLLAPEPPGGAPRGYGRLVTLLGPGGTGKTRLSLAAAERLLAAYSHAVWFVPLAEVRDAPLLPDVLRAALEIAPEPGGAPLEQLVQMLAAQPSLLILDNFEQLVPAGVELVRTLLERAPELVCLVTSRVRLELSAEQDFTLAPLLLPPPTGTPEELLRFPSVQLYCDRSRQVRRDFLLSEKNAADVARVCRALEGIPLAIELAAARAGLLTPRQMLGKLEHRLDFLVGRQQDFAHRHRTLRAAVAWSYDLLTAPLQRCFAQLSIFHGGWTLEAAEAVLAEAEGEAMQHLEELRHCSLIVAEERDGEMRYRMLEVIRDYSAEQLDRFADRRVVATAHLAFYLRLATNPESSDEAAHFRLLAAEHDNFRAILGSDGPVGERGSLALALRDFWMIRGFCGEGQRWFENLLAAAPPAAIRGRLLDAIGILAWKQGDLSTAEASMKGALDDWSAAGREESVAGVLNNLGILARDRGRDPEARDYYERSLAIYRRLDSAAELAAVLCNVGEMAVDEGRYDDAQSCLEESLQIQRRLGLQFACANTLQNLAELHLARGDATAARQRLLESLRIRSELQSREDLPASLATLGRLARLENDPVRAAVFFVAVSQAAEHLQIQLPAAEQQRLARELTELRSLLGDAAFGLAEEAGRRCRGEDSLAWLNEVDSWRATPVIQQE